MIDRFRTLPMWRPSVLVGRTVSDLLSAAVCSVIVALTGLSSAGGPSPGCCRVLAGFGVALLFAYAPDLADGLRRHDVEGPESAMSVGFIIIFPLAFVSNALVPTAHMPSWLR